MANNNNANNVISNNDFANFGDIRTLVCDLTSSFKEFTFLDTPAQIFVNNTLPLDVDNKPFSNIQIKFTNAETTNFQIDIGVNEPFVPFRSASIFLKSLGGDFKVNVGYYTKGTQSIV